MISFEINQVKLEDGEFALRQQLVRDYIINFDVNRLMHTFRLNAGLPSSAEPLGGWESPDCKLRGHFVGHFLSACAKYAYGADDLTMAQKAHEIVQILRECALPNGYLSAFGEEELDLLEKNENSGVWAPYYTLHKILSGLVSCARYLNDDDALVLAENLALYINSRLQKLSYWKIDGILRCTRPNPVNEFGGIGDALYSLWELCGNDQILALAKQFDRDYFVGNLAQDRDVLTDLHSNTHLPQAIAAMHRFKITGERSFLDAGQNFYRFVLQRTFANGNSSSRAAHPAQGTVSDKSEHWGDPGLCRDDLTGGESESCCAHNTERMLAELLQYGTSPIAMLDHLERLKYDAVLNSSSCNTGLSQYHQPLGTECKKKFSTACDDFWCCTGSGVEAMSELQRNIWFKNDDCVVLNMFVSSTLTWREKGVTFCLRTNFPKSLKAEILISAEQPTEVSLALKANGVTGVFVQSDMLHIRSEQDFQIVEGLFHNGDRIDVDLRAEIHEEALGNETNVFCMMYGNVLLAKVAGDYVRGETLTLRPDGTFAGEKCKFRPLYSVEDELYTVYINGALGVEAESGIGAYA